MIFFTKIFVCVVVFLNGIETTEFFTSMDLNSLVNVEDFLLRQFEKNLMNELEVLDQINEKVKVLRKDHEEAVANFTYNKNPIYSYKLIQRMTVNLANVEQFIIEKSINYSKPEFDLPTMSELTKAANAVGRLKAIYKLDMADIAQGILKGTHKANHEITSSIASPLSRSIFYILGLELYESKMYEEAIEWLEMGYRSTDDKKYIFKGDTSRTISLIIKSFLALGDDANAAKWTDISKSHPGEHEDSDEDNDQAPDDVTKLEFNPDSVIFKLCRSKNDVPEYVRKNLKCYYFTNNPYLRIAPIKMERLYSAPEVVMFHGVLSDAEIRYFKNEAISMPVNSSNHSSETSLSKITWITENKSDVTRRVSKRIADFSGMAMETGANFQVNNYGMAGYDIERFDTDPDHRLNPRNRMGRVLFHISDVTLGGATVFSNLNLTVYPVKGSALVWYNRGLSAEILEETLVGSCPVILGDKWVLNTWIYEDGKPE